MNKYTIEMTDKHFIEEAYQIYWLTFGQASIKYIKMGFPNPDDIKSRALADADAALDQFLQDNLQDVLKSNESRRL